MLREHALTVTWMPDSISAAHDQRLGMLKRFQRAFDQLTYPHDAGSLDRICRHLDENHTDVIIAYWGTGPLPDISAIKRERPDIRVVLMVLCFPLAFESSGMRSQHWLIRHVTRHLNGLLYSNSLMKRYFLNRVLGKRGSHLKDLVLKPCWPSSYQSALEKNERASERPNLICVGRTDLSSPTIHAADDP